MAREKRDKFIYPDKKRYCLDALKKSFMTIDEGTEFLNCPLYVLLFFI